MSDLGAVSGRWMVFNLILKCHRVVMVLEHPSSVVIAHLCIKRIPYTLFIFDM